MLIACHNRAVMRGQSDIIRDDHWWQDSEDKNIDGFVIVDADSQKSIINSYLHYTQFPKDGKTFLRINSRAWDNLAAFKRQLYFLASLKDQYHGVALTLPADFNLNYLLKEPQIPHRLVNHPTAEVRPFTRMQCRILDHKKFLETLDWPTELSGEAVIAVQESEGHQSKFKLQISVGKAQVNVSNSAADLEIPDHLWATIALGNMGIRQAVSMELVTAPAPNAIRLLEPLGIGPLPFCEEYF